MARKKRPYTHIEGRPIPVQHGSLLDEMDHDLGGSGASTYKTKRKKNIFGL